ncbi:PIN2/TERF1-interacting telomerase inhibitor 1 [Monodelphis domestica]|uniref:PIN2/TERF1-interacting telomerase inhibitor 1 n=1 Tax=Monodelphis domestica TaxID=13616 RepID=UPI0024E2391E|nr:PIN2/TERF1-interacting telomerase inhibitor 1 [Monodelphis domestica]
MAMLAEPRRKQKWSVDPRNTAWSNDDSKFGQKMLEKMGWSKGKGLGAQEQGATEHIKVQVKNNQLGLGASASHEDDWLAPQEEFNQLLAELNSCHGQEVKDFSDKEKKSFSLEEKSKSSKRRVHYTKFTKGKDLSSRSKTDLDCIFGKRQKSKISKEDQNFSAESEEKATPTVTSNLTVQEYFAKRMLELKNKSAAIHTDSDQTKPFEDKRAKQKKDKKKRQEAGAWDKPKTKRPKKESLEEEEGCRPDHKSKKTTLAENQAGDPGYEQCLKASPHKRLVCDEQKPSTGTSVTEPKKKKKKKKEEMDMASAQDQTLERRKKKKKKKKSLE